MNSIALADEIIAGRRLVKEDDLSAFVTTDLDALRQGADRIRKALVGEKVDLCTIISGISGKCSENCRFCAQSGFHHTECEVHGLLPEEEIFAQAASDQAEGVNRFSIVNSGRKPRPDDFEKIIHVLERMHRELKIGLCCSLGFLTAEQFRRLRDTGVSAA